jgi:hypothetical protein
MTFGAAWVAFDLLDTVPMGWIFTLAVAGTLLNYLIGDLFVLPTFGNIVASIGDVLLGGLTAYMLDIFSPGVVTTYRSLAVFGFIVAIAEFFFHMYLKSTDEVAP